MVSPSEATTDPLHALVTGCRGFTGRYVSETLKNAGYVVTGTVLGAPDAGETELDITSLDACREVLDRVRPTHIVHLAAISFVGYDDPLAMYRVNVFGSLNLLQACHDVGHTPNKILIASSANVYGNRAGTLEEAVTPQPVNHYAASKLSMECLVRPWFDRLPIVIVRPFNYTGRGQSRQFLVPKIVSHFVDRKPILELGNLDVARDFSDVRWVADVYKRLLTARSSSEIVNVCSGQPHSLQEILQMMRENTGFMPEVRVNPLFVRENEVKRLSGSDQKLRSLIELPEPIRLQMTLAWMSGTDAGADIPSAA